ncbi:MAG: DUF481 domain-containing protein [Terriglobia bacterium]
MRSIKTSGALVSLFLAGLSASALHADEVVMKNGDRVTGAVVKKDGKNLTVKTDQFGAVTVAWDQIASIRTDKPVNVVLADGRKVKATMATAGAVVEIAAQPIFSVAPSDITTLRDDAEQAAFDRLQHPGWGDLWAGSAALGLAGTSGNAEALTFTVGANAARATNTDLTKLYFNAIKASALANGKNSDTAQAIHAGWAYNHNVRTKVFVGVFNDYDYDKFQNLNLRFTIGGNVGYHVHKSARSQLDLLGGFDYNRASYFGPDNTTSFAEFMFGNDYTLKLSGNTSLVQSTRFFDSLSNTSAYRGNFDLGASTKISRWLTWNVTASDRYVAIPNPGRKSNDFLYSTGLGITFSR